MPFCKGEILYERDSSNPKRALGKDFRREISAGTDHGLCGNPSGRENYPAANCGSVWCQHLHSDTAVSEKGREYLPSVSHTMPLGKSQKADSPGCTAGNSRQRSGLSGPFHVLPGIPAVLWYFAPGISERREFLYSRIMQPPFEKETAVSFWAVWKRFQYFEQKVNGYVVEGVELFILQKK